MRFLSAKKGRFIPAVHSVGIVTTYVQIFSPQVALTVMPTTRRANEGPGTKTIMTMMKQKRCRHLGTENGLGQPQLQPYHPREHGTSIQDQPPVASSIDARQIDALTPGMMPPESPRTERFVGDLNPEAVIREKLDVTAENQLRDRIGLWINSPAMQSNEGPRDHASKAPPEYPPAVESQTLAPFLQFRHESVTRTFKRLPTSTRDRLIPAYFSKVNRILPLVDESAFSCARAAGTASLFLERAMCLVAAKDRTAIPYLRLVSSGALLSPREFCSEIYKGLVFVMNDGLEPDRITRIRTLALMSLHCEGYEGAEAASMHICQAIHQAQTVGLHLDRPGRISKDPLSDLFWCLWTLDKMHASIGGRPVLLADRDIGIEKPEPKSSHARSPFDVWFAITELLSSVISLYRPTADHTLGWETGFPTFEEIVGDNVREDLDFATLGTPLLPFSRRRWRLGTMLT